MSDESPIKNGRATRDIKAGEVIEIPLEEMEIIVRQTPDYTTAIWRTLWRHWLMRKFSEESWRRYR